MNHYLEKLLQGKKVEWKKLKDICVRSKGTKITATQMRELNKDNAPIKIFGGGQTVAFVNYNDIPEKDINLTPSIIVKSRGIIAFEFYDKPFSHKSEMWSYYTKDEKILTKYIYYYLKNNEVYFQNIGSKMQMPQISIPVTDDFLIPVPPLHVQEKIVDILDKLCKLKNALKNEKSLRLKQYSYYRDKLLSFGDEVEWKTLERCFDILAGGDVPKSALSKEKTDKFYIPILSNGINEKSLYGWTDIPKIIKPSLTISARGTIGWTSYQNKPFFPIVRLLVLTPKIEMNLKYVFYFMKMIENDYKVPTSGIPQLTKPMIKDIKIPLPNLEKQQEIVNILDTFDKLANDITEDLPREIALREKQYQYYRDLLLTFN